MTDLLTTDTADSGEIPRYDSLGDEPTRNLASYILRQGEIYTRHRLAAADTMFIRTDLTADPEQIADAHLRAGEPFLGVPSGRDAWITTGDVPPFLSYALTFTATGELQDPPTGNPPPLPPPPPPGKTVPRVKFRHARRLSPWIGLAIVVGTGLAMWAGGFLAAVAVMGR
jgi:hypothetical protein